MYCEYPVLSIKDMKIVNIENKNTRERKPVFNIGSFFGFLPSYLQFIQGCKVLERVRLQVLFMGSDASIPKADAYKILINAKLLEQGENWGPDWDCRTCTEKKKEVEGVQREEEKVVGQKRYLL